MLVLDFCVIIIVLFRSIILHVFIISQPEVAYALLKISYSYYTIYAAYQMAM